VCRHFRSRYHSSAFSVKEGRKDLGRHPLHVSRGHHEGSREEGAALAADIIFPHTTAPSLLRLTLGERVLEPATLTVMSTMTTSKTTLRSSDSPYPRITEPVPSSFSIHKTSSSALPKSQTLSDTARWQHLSTRTQPAIPFIYGVVTTKIYCLPTCPSRLARRANVTFFNNPIQAAEKGFRACKRCKPDLSPSFTVSRQTQAPPQARALSSSSSSSGSPRQESDQPTIQSPSMISDPETSVPPFDPTDPSLKLHLAISLVKTTSQRGERISLTELANKVGLSKWHLQRAFKRRCGKSPRELGEEILSEQAKKTDESQLPKPISASAGSGMYNDIDFHFEATVDETFGAGLNWSIYHENETESLPQGQKDIYPISVPKPNPVHNERINSNSQIHGITAPFPSLTSNGNGDLTPSLSLSISGSMVNTPSPKSDIHIDDFDSSLRFPGEYSKDFTPEISGILRDLFPEIYEHDYDYGYDDRMMI
jgi:methylphosphotriester-DNA--protein-cysteine methyltransferase